MSVRHFDASSAECLVFTYKEGLLSSIAHDLKIRVIKFTIEVDENRRAIDARFDARSLRVVCAMRDRIEAPHTLSAAQKADIETAIVRDVLHARVYPEIRFNGAAVQEKGDQYLVQGTLTLHGHTRAVPVRVRRADEFYLAAARVHQPDFGIRPYQALLGTLKVKPDVTVHVRLRVPA